MVPEAKPATKGRGLEPRPIYGHLGRREPVVQPATKDHRSWGRFCFGQRGKRAGGENPGLVGEGPTKARARCLFCLCRGSQGIQPPQVIILPNPWLASQRRGGVVEKGKRMVRRITLLFVAALLALALAVPTALAAPP